MNATPGRHPRTRDKKDHHDQRRLSLPELEGIKFDDAAFALIERLIARLEETGVVEVYGLPRMNEVRLAHHRPLIGHPNGRGVFSRLIPSTIGVTCTFRKKVGSSKVRTQLTESTFEDVLSAIVARRAIVKNRVRGFEKVEPNKPGTVSGGQFESNRSRH
jgi:hypothetical protein